MIKDSELIINPDGSIYHLKAKPGDLAQDIITVGDPNRVDLVAQHLDNIELRIDNREFRIVTGSRGEKRVSIVSTGIGTDNVDIVINEIDALFNIDFDSRLIKPDHTALNFIRIGTSGTIRADIAIDSIIISAYAAGMDGLLNFYKSDHIRNGEEESSLNELLGLGNIYLVEGNAGLIEKFSALGSKGITLTAPGFYAPQSRQLRLDCKTNISSSLSDRMYNNLNYTNLEMETAGIYGLSKLLGHRAVSLNAILANRVTGAFSNQPQKTIDDLIEQAILILLEN